MKKALAFLMLLVLTFSVVAYAPEAESFAKAKKKKPKAETAVSEEASRFTIKTWKPTYSNWSKSEIEKASTRGTGKNLFDKYGALYDLKLAKNKKFVNFLYSIDSVTGGGWYGVLEDNQDVICKYLQKNIKTVADLWLYFTLARYSYNEDELGNMGAAMQGWQTENSAKINILGNCGVCMHTAMVGNYLLEGDYEETGFVTVHSNSGHQYMYVKDKGVYYFIDFTDFTADNGQNGEAKYTLDRILEDRLNGYDEKSHIKEYKEFFDDTYKDRICFWSGTSLDDPSATKAVLIHDTMDEKNYRKDLDWNWTEENTSYIWATKYYAGMEGSNIAFLVEDCNRGAKTVKEENGLEYGGTKYKLSYLAIMHPEYTKYQTLYIDTTGKRMGSPFKEVAPVDIELVPFFCDLSPEAQAIVDSQETYMQRVYRQTKNGLDDHITIRDSDGRNSLMSLGYTRKFLPFNKEVRIGAFWAYERLLSYTSQVEDRMTLDQCLKEYGMEDYYGVKLIKR